MAPDIMVAFDRPKGYRKSYRQWEEDNIPPQVVFEIISPGNRKAEMIHKFEFYQNYGVEEYYIYDPSLRKRKLQGWIRGGNQLIEIVQMSGWVSPRLQIIFEMENRELEIYTPNGEKFLTSVELAQKAQQSELKAQKLAQKLRELGINPDEL